MSVPPGFALGYGLAAIREEIRLHDLGVLIRQDHRATRVPDELGGTVDHAVTLAGGLALDLASGSDLEALFGTALGLHLGHLASFLAAHGRNSRGGAYVVMVEAWKPPRHAPPGGS